MRIYRPIQTNNITQKFGDNFACIRIYPPLKIAYKSKDVCPTGYTDFYATMGLAGHNGYDLKSWHGEPVYFPVAGDYEWFGINELDSNGGRGVNVFSKGRVLGEYRKFRFWHLKESVIKDGDRIIPGQLLGYADSTGASSATHLHFDMKLADEERNSLNTENGYAGCVDIEPYFENEFILDILHISPPELGWVQKLYSLLASLG